MHIEFLRSVNDSNEEIGEMVHSEQDDTVMVEDVLCDDLPTPKKTPATPKNFEKAKQARPFFPNASAQRYVMFIIRLKTFLRRTVTNGARLSTMKKNFWK